jgi:uncharacterized protein (TIGR00297 family)
MNSPLADNGSLVAGIALAVVVAAFAQRQRALSTSGAVAAVLVATACVAAGWSWAIILIVFFVAGTTVSHIGGQSKRFLTEDVVEKGGARDAWQVLANGGPFAAAAIASIVWPSDVWQIAGVGAIAASSADTWATEIGTLSKQMPRSILGFRPVPTGTSGGVTWLGMCASIGGALLIALVAFLAGWRDASICAALVGGVGGCLVDSILGASLQVRRWCARCEKTTERTIHACGTTTGIAGGVRWLNNDAVNFLSSIAGGLMGAVCLR